MGSLQSITLRSLLISTLDWSNLQTFGRWKPYPGPVFNRTILNRVPEVETEEGKAGVYKELAFIKKYKKLAFIKS